MLLELQIQVLSLLWATRQHAHQRVETIRSEGEQGEITATTAMIVILVIAAIAAGTVIAAKINANANKVPEP